MFTNRLKWYTLAGVLLLPLMFAAGLLSATWNLNDRLHTVQAAIVNNDEAVTVNGQTVPLGRQLTAALVDSSREQNFEWVIASEQDASDGLKDGSYAAVVTIPKNFSQSATSFSDAASAQKATIKIDTSPNGGIAETSLGQSVAKEAVTILNTSLTKTYLDQIFVGFNSMNSQFTDLKTGTRQVADGASSLSEGISTAASGSSDLSTGLNTLAGNSSSLNSGMSQSSSGAAALSSGLSQLDSGAKALPAQTQQLASGTSAYVGGVNTLITQVKAQSAASQSLGTLKTGVTDTATAAAQLNEGLVTYQNTLKAMAASTTPSSSGSSSNVQATSRQDGGNGTSCPSSIQEKYGEQGCAGYAAGVAAGASQVANAALEGLADQENGTGIMSGSAGLSAGTAALAQGVSAITVPTEAETKATNAKLTQLQSAGTDLKNGTASLAAGMPALTSGISQSAAGASSLASGLSQLSAGVTAYTAGVDQTATGAAQLSSGLEQASDGAKSLSTGTGQIADGVSKGADQVPTYTEPERKNLADVVAAPVSDENVRGLPTPTIPWASLVMMLALWLGALAMYIVAPAIRKGAAMSTATSSRVLVESLAPGVMVGVLQAGLVSLVASLFDVPEGLSLFGILLLGSVTFVTINFALTALFGNVGRWLSAGLVLITTATALTSALPTWFDFLKPLSPVSSALEGTRAVMMGQSPVSGIIALTGWLLVGVAGSVIAVIRSRKVPLGDVLKLR